MFNTHRHFLIAHDRISLRFSSVISCLALRIEISFSFCVCGEHTRKCRQDKKFPPQREEQLLSKQYRIDPTPRWCLMIRISASKDWSSHFRSLNSNCYNSLPHCLVLLTVTCSCFSGSVTFLNRIVCLFTHTNNTRVCVCVHPQNKGEREREVKDGLKQRPDVGVCVSCHL